MPTQARQPQPRTEADCEALLAITSSESLSGAAIMNMLPLFAHASFAYVERFRELLQQMALHDIQFLVQPELPQPTGADYVGSATGAGRGSLGREHLQPLIQQPTTMDELEEAVRAVRI